MAACPDMPFVLLIPRWPKAKTRFALVQLLYAVSPLAAVCLMPLFDFHPFFFFSFSSNVEGCIAAAGQGREGGHVSGGGARFLATGQRKRGVCVCARVCAARVPLLQLSSRVVSCAIIEAACVSSICTVVRCCMTVELHIQSMLPPAKVAQGSLRPFPIDYTAALCACLLFL